MRELTPTRFIPILRPACMEDEKTAIAVAALLGAAVGELQAVLVLRLPPLSWVTLTLPTTGCARGVTSPSRTAARA